MLIDCEPLGECETLELALVEGVSLEHMLDE